MSVRKFKVGMAAVLILGIVALFFVVGAFAQSASEKLNCPSGLLSILDVEEGINVECVNALFATLTPTSGAPTDTPVPPTDTPVVPPTDTPVPGGEPFAGAPKCVELDGHANVSDNPYFTLGEVPNIRMWHDLWNEIEGCHYDHEHGDNPHVLDGLLGTDLYELGGDISYPWETPNENELKHEGYTWVVYADNDCSNLASGWPGCIRNIRTQHHAIFATLGALAQFHSVWIETEACMGDDCGFYDYGGHVNYGCLVIGDTFCVLGEDRGGGRPYRGHKEDSNGAGWFGHLGVAGQQDTFIHESFDAFNRMKLSDPTDFTPTCPDWQCEMNASAGRLSQVTFTLLDSEVDFEGFRDRFGNVVSTCELGPDCVPVKASGLPAGKYNFQAKMNAVDNQNREFDISPFFEDGSRDWWIEYPN